MAADSIKGPARSGPTARDGRASYKPAVKAGTIDTVHEFSIAAI